MADLTDKIEEVADGPASASGPAGSVSAQSIPNLIQADQYLAGKRAAAEGAASGNFLARALRRAKVVPPSALGS